MDGQSGYSPEAMLIRQRYKVVRVIDARQDYALLEAVDIAERETPTRLLNLYEGELLRRYGSVFSGVRTEDCPAFRGLFLEGDTLIAVFDDCAGETIDAAFYRGDGWTWEDRLEFAEIVLHQALAMANLPPEVSCCAMLTENLFVDAPERRVRLRFAIPPTEGLNARELVLLTGDQVRKILPDSLRATDTETAFQQSLDRGEFHSVVALYAAWRKAEPVIRAEREEFANRSFFMRGWIMLRRWIKRHKLKNQGGRI